jgi:hypothetical protein
MPLFVHVRINVSADVAELADAQVSEACGVTPVEVRVLSSAPKILFLPILFHQITFSGRR